MRSWPSPWPVDEYDRGGLLVSVTLEVDWEKLKSSGPLEVVDAFPVGWNELVDWDIPLQNNAMTLEIKSIDQYPCFRLVRVR